MAKRKNRFVDDAAMQALVRYGPELSGLKELQRQAAATLGSRVRQAHGGARGIVAATSAAAPEIADLYDNAGLTQAKLSDTLIGKDLAGLGQVADSIKAGAALEASGMAGRLNEARTEALTDLSQRRVQARQGEQFAVQQATNEFADELAKVLRRKQDVRREMGAYKASTVAGLQEDARDRKLRLQVEKLGNSQQERNSLRSAGIDPETGEPIKGGPLDPDAPRYKDKSKPKAKTPRLPGGAKLATPQQHGAVRDKIALGISQAKALAAGPDGLKRSELAPLLVQGVRATKDRAGVQKVGELYASVALDMVFDGHVSRRNVELLHRRGLSIKRLGYKPPGHQPKRKQPGASKFAGVKTTATVQTS